MESTLDQAKDLMTLAAGPSLVGVSVLLGYASRILSGSARVAIQGWRTIGAGVLVLGWMVMFLCLAAGIVFDSWRAAGPVNPVLVLLSASWFAATVLSLTVLCHARAVLSYLAEAYGRAKLPLVLKLIPGWFLEKHGPLT